MAGEDTPRANESKEESQGQKKRKGGLPIPACLRGMMDGLVIVLAPFVIFVVIFLYVMGFIPPQPVIIEVTGEAAAGFDSTGTTPDQSTSQGMPGPLAGREPGPAEATEGETNVPFEAMQPETVYVEPVAPPAGETAADEAQIREKKIKQLAKVYERMNAASVASIVANLSEQEAVEILSRMNPRNAAKVLATLEPEQAAVLSLLLTRTED